MIDCKYFRKNKCSLINGRCDPYNRLCSNSKYKKKRKEKDAVLKSTSAVFNADIPYSQKHKNSSSTRTRVTETSADYGRIMRVDYNPWVFVYGGYLTVSHKDIENRKLEVRDLLTNRTLYMNVAYNIKTKRIYIATNQLKNIGGIPNVKYLYCYECSQPLNDYRYEFSDISLLGLYGYKVGKSGLGKHQRETILSFIIDNNVMTPSEIISLLNGHIMLRDSRTDNDYSKAIKDWKEDIIFVSNY